jgi:hypothetical protein
MENITNEQNAILEKYRNSTPVTTSARVRCTKVSFARTFIRWCNENNIKVG